MEMQTSTRIISFFICILLPISVWSSPVPRTLKISSIFSFGDSHSDTGNLDTAFPNFQVPGQTKAIIPSQHPPYGRDFHDKHDQYNGRFSNGFLLIDYIAQHFHFPLLSPYLRSTTLGSDFSSGVNFAYSGAAAIDHDEVHNPFSLALQTSDFLRFQALANRTKEWKMPAPSVFKDGLFVINMGGSDLTYNLLTLNNTFDQMVSSIVPTMVSTIVNETVNLYVRGSARNFLLINQPAVGCQPLFLTKGVLKGETQKDSLQCIDMYNRVAREFNSQLYSSLETLRQRFPDGMFIYADFYQANLDVLLNPRAYGVSPRSILSACCGYGRGVGSYYKCDAVSLQGVSTLYSCGCSHGRDCKNNEEFVSWDGLHYTQRFNEIAAHKFMEESSRYLKPAVRFVPSHKKI